MFCIFWTLIIWKGCLLLNSRCSVSYKETNKLLSCFSSSILLLLNDCLRFRFYRLWILYRSYIFPQLFGNSVLYIYNVIILLDAFIRMLMMFKPSYSTWSLVFVLCISFLVRELGIFAADWYHFFCLLFNMVLNGSYIVLFFKTRLMLSSRVLLRSCSAVDIELEGVMFL